MPAPRQILRGFPLGADGRAPPDTNGDVGPNHYVQMVNSAFQVWNKSGGSLYGPATSTPSGAASVVPAHPQRGDPVVLYDSIANRWLISQFTAAVPIASASPSQPRPIPTGSRPLLSSSARQSSLTIRTWGCGLTVTI